MSSPSIKTLIKFAARQSPSRARMVLDAITAKENFDEETQEALASFERDMQPLCTAIVEALQAGDRAAMEGLRAMLPELMREINESPELADVLSRQAGRAMLEGLKSKPKEGA